MREQMKSGLVRRLGRGAIRLGVVSLMLFPLVYNVGMQAKTAYNNTPPEFRRIDAICDEKLGKTYNFSRIGHTLVARLIGYEKEKPNENISCIDLARNHAYWSKRE